MMRIFVGLAMPPAVQEILSHRASGIPRARWVAGRNLHLTLRFIGEIDEVIAEEVNFALSTIQAAQFELSLTGIDCFQSRQLVRAIWTAVDGGQALHALQNRVENALVGIGLAPEPRKFTPHVTLARLNRAPIESVSPYLAHNMDINVPKIEIERFSLIQSHLSPTGAEYEIISDYALEIEK
jgi:2'-5' RNA ligase